MRLDGIDILRGLAVSIVVVYHFFVLLELTAGPAFPYINTLAYLGVPLFFVISGYLIYRSVDRNVSQKGIKKGVLSYFFHRLFRILPAYYFNLFIIFIMAGFIINQDYYYSASFFKQFFSHLIFTSYFKYQSAGFGINGAYWTLSIEMLWYIVVPFILFYFKKTRALLLIAFLSFIYIFGMSHGWFDHYFDLDGSRANYALMHSYYLSQLPGQINFFIAGILIYKYQYHFKLQRVYYAYLLAIFLLLLYVWSSLYFVSYSDTIGKHMMVLLVVSVLFILLYSVKSEGLSFLEWIGKISYSLYLWHMPILFVMNKSHILEERSLLETTVFFFFLLFSISSMSYYFIEEGGFALRKKLTARFFENKELVKLER